MESMLFMVHHTDDLPLVRQQLQKLLQNLLGVQSALFEVAVNEALKNALHSSTQTYGEPLVRIRVSLLGQAYISVRILDYGDGFPGNAILRSLPPKTPFESIPANLPEDNMSLHLMRAATDHLTYNHLGNEILMIKHLPN